MLKVSRDEIQRNSPKIPAPVKNSGDLQILENAIGSCNTVTKVILSALSTGLHLTGAGRFENAHRNERPSTTTVRVFFFFFHLVHRLAGLGLSFFLQTSGRVRFLALTHSRNMSYAALHDALPSVRAGRPKPHRAPEAH